MLKINQCKNLKLTHRQVEELMMLMIDNSTKVHDNEELKYIYLKLSLLRN